MKTLLLVFILLMATPATADGELRIAAVFTHSQSPYVIASVEVNSDDHWFRWGQGAGLYVGDPRRGVLHRLVTKPINMRESDVFAHTSSVFDIEVFLHAIGDTAQMSINLQVRQDPHEQFTLHSKLGPNDRTGDIVLTYRNDFRRFEYDMAETAMWAHSYAAGTLHLQRQENFRFIERTYIDPNAEIYYIVTSKRPSSLMDQYTREFEIHAGRKGDLKPLPLESATIMERDLDLDLDYAMVSQVIGNWVEEEEKPIDDDNLQKSVFFVLEDGRSIVMPGTANERKLPRIISKHHEVFLEDVGLSPQELLAIGFDVAQLKAEDYGLCEQVFYQ